ncbi:MAG: hypothetical protein LBI05_06470, partial [Planctomycetaceae bacterium]|nr:hypothetical protein [Planctomycetaceae bacterium]
MLHLIPPFEDSVKSGERQQTADGRQQQTQAVSKLNSAAVCRLQSAVSKSNLTDSQNGFTMR